MLYTVGKIFLKDIKYCRFIFLKDWIWEKYEHPKFWDNKSPSFGTPTWESQGTMTFGCNPREKAQNIL